MDEDAAGDGREVREGPETSGCICVREGRRYLRIPKAV